MLRVLRVLRVLMSCGRSRGMAPGTDTQRETEQLMVWGAEKSAADRHTDGHRRTLGLEAG